MRASTEPKRLWARSAKEAHDAGVGDVGHVGGHSLTARIELLGDGDQLVSGAGRQHDVGPVAEGTARTLPAEALAHPGDQYRLVLEDHSPLLDDGAGSRGKTARAGGPAANEWRMAGGYRELAGGYDAGG